ncbi:hypothetical protein Bandiella_00973 [Candidatus Bandiella woodruffii]|uniref:Uncharacterized protein n=1 Tax=Candidatus Bandiella euplotis TaxID=1664265 RepID=A0ABZ0UNJ7_9RICK|nr:hypothetical protein Bandiella_00973 [Candidatus Bandiella woodruffii]
MLCHALTSINLTVPYLLLLHFLHSVFIFLFSLLLAIFILASYLSYGNTPKNFLQQILDEYLIHSLNVARLTLKYFITLCLLKID